MKMNYIVRWVQKHPPDNAGSLGVYIANGMVPLHLVQDPWLAVHAAQQTAV